MTSVKGMIRAITIALSLINVVNALYEDQIKKFDWRKQQIGVVTETHLNLNSFHQPQLVVRTKENVIAALCPKTGEIIWRKVLEKTARGQIKLLQLLPSTMSESSSTAAAKRNANLAYDVVSVQGHAPALIRGWDSKSGNLEWEWSLHPLNAEQAASALWFYDNAVLFHIIPVWGSHLEVTQYFASTGQAVRTSEKVLTPWIAESSCSLSGRILSCMQDDQMISVDVTATVPTIIKKRLTHALPLLPKVVKGVDGVYAVNNALVAAEDTKVCGQLHADSFILGSFNGRKIWLTASVKDGVLELRAYGADDCENIEMLRQQLLYPENVSTVELLAFDCKYKSGGMDFKSCMYILGTEDEAVLAVQQNRIRWVREEALANVVAVEFIDLPLTHTESALEDEMQGDQADIASAFSRRLAAQAAQLKGLFLQVLGLGPPQTESERAGLVRDAFGLHKILAVLTASGKIFGIDNISGKHHWKFYLPGVKGFNNEQQMRLLVQRTSKHYPLQPICTILARDKITEHGVLYRFNPITGLPIEGGLIKLDYKFKQVALLAEVEPDFVRGLLVLDFNNVPRVYPEHARKMAEGFFVFTADVETSVIEGFYIKYNEKLQKLSASLHWNIYLGGSYNDNKIVAIAAKNPAEHVHSQGRVLSDRSVLYKYINPNLIAVATQATDAIHKTVLSVYLIDVVSGAIIYAHTHRRVRGPPRIIHSENWLAYTYYNEKVRRTEICTLELYEGKEPSNQTSWSSFSAIFMPLVEKQSYILPFSVEAIRETITERGITNKHVLLGTSNGAIIEMPWALLDPRRLSTTAGNQVREESVLPYIPELPFVTENIINYNQTLAQLKNIFTAPSGLESTCLVVATGLDMFVTRVSPSKTFDLLKEDFDYILISAVLVALTTGSLVAKHLASRKVIKQAWK